MQITYETLYSAIVTILVILLYFYMGSVVGRMRGRHNIAAPAVIGHPEFERAFRVHTNTLEQLVVFLPLLWLATVLYRDVAWLPVLFGLVFLIGRIVYMQRYMSEPKSRGPGIMIGMLGILGLLVLTIIGIVQDWVALSAT
ncbi:MAG TPA: MAPEG family protein [Rhizomicrobium sp.]|jgi:glutathione S-transferase|nr:MAPEG family protein [Rhizomicrobium sp.]